MTEDVEYAMQRLCEALADGDSSWIQDAIQEVAIALDEQRDELVWAVSRLLNARHDGDEEWIEDAAEELSTSLLTHGVYSEINLEHIGNPSRFRTFMD